MEENPFEEAAEETTAEPEERETREDKKQNRFREQIDRADAAEQRAARLEARLAEVEARQQSRQTEDPYKEKLAENRRERVALSEEFAARQAAGNADASYIERMQEKADELETAKARMIIDQREAEKARNRDPRQEVLDQVKVRHPDIAQDQRKLAWAQGRILQRQAEGESWSWDQVDSVMDETREHYNEVRGQRGDMPDHERSRYASTPRSGAPRPEPKNRTMKMTAEHKRMADHAFGYIEDEGERYKKWAKEVGPEFVKLEQQDGR